VDPRIGENSVEKIKIINPLPILEALPICDECGL
jgi:hypothetical protein